MEDKDKQKARFLDEWGDSDPVFETLAFKEAERREYPIDDRELKPYFMLGINSTIFTMTTWASLPSSTCSCCISQTISIPVMPIYRRALQLCNIEQPKKKR